MKRPNSASKTAFLLAFVLLLGMTACKSGASASTATAELPDGTYLLLNTYPDRESIGRTKGRVIPFSHRFLDDNTNEKPFFIEVAPKEYVPLRLASPPDSVTQEDKRIHLLLTLTPDAKDELADFTGKHLNKMVAIVVGGEGVTMHKIKSRIEGGKLQITRCTDNACEYLFYELQDNVAE